MHGSQDAFLLKMCLAFSLKESKPVNILLWCSESKPNSNKLVHGNRKLRLARKQHRQGGGGGAKKRMLLSGLFLFYFYFYCCWKQVTYCSQVGLGLK